MVIEPRTFHEIFPNQEIPMRTVKKAGYWAMILFGTEHFTSPYKTPSHIRNNIEVSVLSCCKG